MRTTLIIALLAASITSVQAQSTFRESSQSEIDYWTGRVADTPAKCSAKMKVWAKTSKLPLEAEDCQYGNKAPVVAQEPAQASPDALLAYMKRMERKHAQQAAQRAADRDYDQNFADLDTLSARRRADEIATREKFEADYPDQEVLTDIRTGEPRYVVSHQ